MFSEKLDILETFLTFTAPMHRKNMGALAIKHFVKENLSKNILTQKLTLDVFSWIVETTKENMTNRKIEYGIGEDHASFNILFNTSVALWFTSNCDAIQNVSISFFSDEVALMYKMKFK